MDSPSDRIIKLRIQQLSSAYLTSSTVPIGEVASLQHEPRNDAVKCASLVVKSLATPTSSFFSGAKSTEILSSLGNDVGSQDEGNSSCVKKES